MSPHLASNSDSSVPHSYRMLGAFGAGFCEVVLFHPADTIAKRLMSNEKAIRGPTMNQTFGNLNQVVFKKASEKPFVQKFQSLYPGLVYGMSYKVLQRGYKFGGQPIVRESLNKNGVGTALQDRFGQKGGKLLTESIAGSMIGIGEIVLLPIDRLKILSQTHPEALQGRGVVDIVKKEGLGLYAGAGATAVRNAPGSFFLFGGTAFTKEVIFRVSETKKATTFQNFVASTVGASLSIIMTNPMDVVKTRIQNKSFGETHTSGRIIRSILREEGVTAFFKGSAVKVTAASPKVVFAYTATEYFVNTFMAFRPPAAAKKN